MEENLGSKTGKARRVGVKVLSEQEFAKRVWGTAATRCAWPPGALLGIWVRVDAGARFEGKVHRQVHALVLRV